MAQHEAIEGRQRIDADIDMLCSVCIMRVLAEVEDVKQFIAWKRPIRRTGFEQFRRSVLFACSCRATCSDSSSCLKLRSFDPANISSF